MARLFRPKNSCSRTSDNSRAQLLEAARELFAQKGLDGVTVREIAGRAGVNVCLVSYYFDGKEGLYKECLEQFGQERVAQSRSLLESVNSVEELRVRTKLLITEILNAQANQMDLTRMLLKEIDGGLPHAADVFERTFLGIIRSMIAFFEEGQRKGLVNPKIEPIYLTLIIHGFISHMTRVDPVGQRYFEHSIQDPANRERMVDSLMQLLVNGAFTR